MVVEVETTCVCIVLPVHNGAQYLQQAIDSVRSQTYPHWRLVIVDDASTDDSARIAAEAVVADERIQLRKHDVNQGLPCALNAGFRDAVEPLLTWVSDDNVLRPTALQTMVERCHADDSPDIVFADYEVIGEAGECLGVRQLSVAETIALGRGIGAIFLYRRIVHERLRGYDPGLHLVEDLDFWLRAYRYFRFAHIPVVLLAYREHGGSLTTTRVREIGVLRYTLACRLLDDPFQHEKQWVMQCVCSAIHAVTSAGAYTRGLVLTWRLVRYSPSSLLLPRLYGVWLAAFALSPVIERIRGVLDPLAERA